jgi:hypothetical protein
MSGDSEGRGPRGVAQLTVRLLARALAICLMLKILARAINPLLPALEAAVLTALLCLWIMSRLHL